MPSQMLEYSRWSIALIAIPPATTTMNVADTITPAALRTETGSRRNRFTRRSIVLSRFFPATSRPPARKADRATAAPKSRAVNEYAHCDRQAQTRGRKNLPVQPRRPQGHDRPGAGWNAFVSHPVRRSLREAITRGCFSLRPSERNRARLVASIISRPFARDSPARHPGTTHEPGATGTNVDASLTTGAMEPSYTMPRVPWHRARPGAGRLENRPGLRCG